MFTTLVAAWISSACAPATSSPGFTEHSTAVYADLALPPLVCATEQDCPEGIGELVTFGTRGRERCTFTLISSHLILTANHCIPWASVRPDRTFIGNCWARWPNRKGVADTDPIPCESVERASKFAWNKRDSVQSDFAFVKLASPSTRPTTEIAAFSSTPPDQLLIYGIDPSHERDVLSGFTCKQDLSHQLVSRPGQKEGALIFPDCRIRHGNSGGPILDPAQRKIVGVVSFLDDVPAGENSKAESKVGVGVRVPAP